MAERFRVDVIGEEELQSKLRTLTAAAQGQALAAAVMSGAQLIQNAAKDKAPYRTGTLKRSIHAEIEESGATRATAIIGTDVVYAAQVEFGGTILPKKAKLLHWVKDGQHYFAKSVTQVARPYLRPAFDETSDDAAKEVGAALKQAIARVAS